MAAPNKSHCLPLTSQLPYWTQNVASRYISISTFINGHGEQLQDREREKNLVGKNPTTSLELKEAKMGWEGRRQDAKR